MMWAVRTSNSTPFGSKSEQALQKQLQNYVNQRLSKLVAIS